MKNNIKSTLSARLMLFSAALSLIAVTSCKDDWDEHYDAEASGLTYNGDIMSYLNSNSQLSDFAAVVKAAGFETDMASSQIRTLWAPVNGSFNKDSLMTIVELGESKSVINGFIKNHMARYSISCNKNSAVDSKNILLLNSKIAVLSPDGKFGTANIVSPNVSCKNGVVHVIDKAQKYMQNLYELIEMAHAKWLLENPNQIFNDSLISMYTFLEKYNADSLDVNKSVFREIDEDGNRVYVDSVLIRNNTVLNGIDALIYSEDSNYFAIIPSVEAYQARVEEAKKYLVYNPYENQSDSMMCDSLQYYNANVFALTDLFFNVNTNTRNGFLVQDSVVSSQYKRTNWENHVYYSPYQEGGILFGGKKSVCSNGTAYMVDQYPLSIRDQFLKKIDTDCTRSVNIDQTTNSDGTLLFTKNVNTDFPVYNLVVNKRDDSGKVININTNYLDVMPSSSSLNPYIAFKVKNTLRTTYDIYLVYCPIWVGSGYDSYEEALMGHEIFEGTNQDPLRPYYFKVCLYERNDNGIYPTSGVVFKNPENGSNYFTTNVENYVDTLYLGQYTSKYAYYNTTSEGILVQMQASVTAKNTSKYSREMLFCKVILKPHDETEASAKFRNR